MLPCVLFMPVPYGSTNLCVCANVSTCYCSFLCLWVVRTLPPQHSFVHHSASVHFRSAFPACDFRSIAISSFCHCPSPLQTLPRHSPGIRLGICHIYCIVQLPCLLLLTVLVLNSTCSLNFSHVQGCMSPAVMGLHS